MIDAVCLWIGRVVVYGGATLLAVALVVFAFVGILLCYAWGLRGTR